MSSARTAERLARILAMVPWVIANPGTTVDEVCRRFGYTRGDLVRDLDLVFVCGLPGYGPGDLMEAYLDGDEVVIDMADYFRRPLALTGVEALTLLASGMAILSAGTADSALESGVAKLAAVLLPDPGVIDVGLSELPELGMLRAAARNGSVTRIEYMAISSGKVTERDIEPWRVFSGQGNWYVSAHCRLAGGERIFRVDRIRRASVSGDHFTPPAVAPAAQLRYTPGADDVVVRLALRPGAAWVAEYYPVREIERTAESLVIEFAASDPATTARLLLRLGSEAELLDGDDAPVVRTAAAALRDRILARYG